MGEIIQFEEWRPVPDYEGRYAVSSLGRIKSLKRFAQRSDGHTQTISERILKPAPNDNGYLGVTLYGLDSKKSKTIHRLVCLAFLPDSHFPEAEAAHRNGVKTDNRLTNLYWATREENLADRDYNGNPNAGERNGRSRFSDAECLEIIRARGSLREIGERFGLSGAHVSHLKNGKRRFYLHPANREKEAKAA